MQDDQTTIVLTPQYFHNFNPKADIWNHKCAIPSCRSPGRQLAVCCLHWQIQLTAFHTERFCRSYNGQALRRFLRCRSSAYWDVILPGAARLALEVLQGVQEFASAADLPSAPAHASCL